MSSIYFAFGSNLRRARLERRVGPVRALGLARLEGYRHTFNKHGADDTAKGNIVASQGHRVLGAAYELSEDQFETLATYELGYEKVVLDVDLSGQQVEVATYRGIRLNEGLAPTRWYLDHYLEGGLEHGIAESYFREIFPPWYWESEPHDE